MNEPVPPAGSAAPVPQRGWWSRNWKWFVPTGCFTLFVLFVAFITLIVLVVFGAMKSTDVYKTALRRAQQHPEVVEALGSPIDDGLFLSGSTNVNGASGSAELAIPISGPKGKGTLYVSATKSAGEWSYSKLVVEVKGTGNRIDLGPDSSDNDEIEAD